MSDHTSAALFGTIFEMLAKDPTPQHKRMAAKLWSLQGEYDFHPDQMGADKELMRLGLAKKGVNPDYPQDGEVMLYKGLDY